MSKNVNVEPESFVVVFEGLDKLDNLITQSEISLAMRYFQGVLDDRVRPVVQKKEDLP